MKCWTWNIFCALSLVIFATSVTLWARMDFVADLFVGAAIAIVVCIYCVVSIFKPSTRGRWGRGGRGC